MAVRRLKGTEIWIADGRDAFGRRKQIRFETQDAAKQHESDLRRERRTRRTSAYDPGTTFESYARTWLAARVLKATSRDRYSKALENHVYPTLGKLRLTEVSRVRVRKFISERMTDPRGNVLSKRPLHKETVRLILTVVGAVLNAAVADEILAASPVIGLGREVFGKVERLPEASEDDVRAMATEQLRAFLVAAREHVADAYPALFVLAMTGLRIGELMALRLEDVDAGGACLRIRRQLSGKLKTQESRRDVAVPADVLAFLRDVVRERREADLRAGRPGPGWLFFPDLPANPGQLDENRVARFLRRGMARALEFAGLPFMTPHALRHTYASRLISAGVSPEWVRRQLGHASIKITLDYYGRWLPMEPPAGALDRLSSGVTGPGCNVLATSGAESEAVATGTDGESVTYAVASAKITGSSRTLRPQPKQTTSNVDATETQLDQREAASADSTPVGRDGAE